MRNELFDRKEAIVYFLLSIIDAVKPITKIDPTNSNSLAAQ